MVSGAESGCQARFQAQQRGLGQRLERDPFPSPLLRRRLLLALFRKFKAATAQIAVVDAGPFAELGGERRKQGRAVSTKLIEGSTGLKGIARRQNAGSGPRSLLAEVALVDDGDA